MKNIAMMIMILLLTNCNNKHQNLRDTAIANEVDQLSFTNWIKSVKNVEGLTISQKETLTVIFNTIGAEKFNRVV